MPEPTIGEQEDELAFREVYTKFWQEEGKSMPFGLESYIETAQRRAWNAGMERGEEKRGCCHPPPSRSLHRSWP